MSKITEQFVPYKQAKELKELGFVDPCLALYEVDDRLKNGQRLMFITHEETNPLYNNDKSINIAAPLYSQAFDWFREKYKLFSSVKPSFCNNSSSIIFLYYYISNNEDFTCIIEYQTYQEAQLACLDKLIELVKGK